MVRMPAGPEGIMPDARSAGTRGPALEAGPLVPALRASGMMPSGPAGMRTMGSDYTDPMAFERSFAAEAIYWHSYCQLLRCSHGLRNHRLRVRRAPGDTAPRGGRADLDGQLHAVQGAGRLRRGRGQRHLRP